MNGGKGPCTSVPQRARPNSNRIKLHTNGRIKMKT